MSGHSSQNAQCANGKDSWGRGTKYGERKSSYVILCGAKPPGGSVQNWECKVTAFNYAVQSLHLGILESLKCQMTFIYINSLSYFRKLHPLFYKMDLCGIKCPFLIDSSQVAEYTWAFFSQIVTKLRLMLMYYTNFIAFMEDPQKDECAIWAERAKSPPSEPLLFD